MASAAPHLDAFLEAARYFIGLEEDPDGSNRFTDERGNEMFSTFGGGWGSSWCAILVSVCAIKAGIDWVLIATNEGVGGVTSNSVDYLDAEWIPGPYTNGGVAVTPIPGDLISFSFDGPYYSGYEHGSHIGIVEYVDEDGDVHTIEGNSGNACRQNVYSPDYSCINGYCRPDWASIGDNVNEYLASAGVTAIKGPLYTTRNDRHDMTIRQVGYLNNQYALSNDRSEISISVINYTALLGDLYDLFAPATMPKVFVDTSNLSGNVKISVDYFLSMGYSASAASAITGCLKTYSNVSPTFSKYITNINGIDRRLEGVAAWNTERLQPVKDRLGYGWNINLSGQLECVLDELNKDYANLVSMIKSATLNIVGVDQATTLVMRQYNDYYSMDSYITQAKDNAEEIYNKLVITNTATVGNIDNLRDEGGNLLSAQYSVSIPSDVPQTGIIDDYTSYSYWYTRWASGTMQRTLADTWAYQGFPCDKGVALIGGYYCVAVRPKFGKCGDIIVVTLEDGTAFPAIICDEKGEDAGSEWGHIKEGGRISVIEWERIVTYNGSVQTEGAGATLVDSLGFDDWLYKDVINITNYGQYL